MILIPFPRALTTSTSGIRKSCTCSTDFLRAGELIPPPSLGTTTLHPTQPPLTQQPHRLFPGLGNCGTWPGRHAALHVIAFLQQGCWPVCMHSNGCSYFALTICSHLEHLPQEQCKCCTQCWKCAGVCKWRGGLCKW